ncbi:MAG: hypothetical protein ACM3ZE_04390, partial [Myxococcales bacterium]
AAASAKIAAEKQAEEAAQKAKEEAAKAFAEKKAGIVKGLQGQSDAIDRKFVYLKDKASKLKGTAKTKADGALTAVDNARAQLSASLSEAQTATDATLVSLSEKVTSDLKTAQKSLDQFETAVTGK